MNLGYNKDHIIVTRLFGNLKQKVETVKTELMKSPYIRRVTASSDITTDTYHSTSGSDIWWEGKNPDENLLMYHYYIDKDFIPTMGMQIIDGRNFSDISTSDGEHSYIVNEAAVRAMGMTAPVGKRFRLHSGGDGRIIGVVKDFHFKSLHNEIGPIIFRVRPERYYYLLLKFQSHDSKAAINYLEAICKRFNPEHPFEYFFLNQQYDSLYRSEERMGTIMMYFACLAVFISCLGLFGLSSYVIEQRTKEIGIRKILGASVSSIVKYISKEFIILVVIANIIVWPLTYLLLDRWIQNFAYRTNIELLTFIYAGMLALVITILTVSYQSIKAALANPVDSLRYE